MTFYDNNSEIWANFIYCSLLLFFIVVYISDTHTEIFYLFKPG